MELIELLQGYDGIEASLPQTGVAITGLTSDSRRVRPGYLFAALPGVNADGTAFIADAIDKGAAAVLAARDGALATSAIGQPAIPVITSVEPRRDLALLAARYYHHQPETVAAVTGTNGKTSVVWFLRQLWAHAGLSAASLGTLGVHGPMGHEAGSLTTPDPVDLHATLVKLYDSGISHLAMEASSHGLAQFRLDGVRIRAAAFTNLTRDHLDYHGSEAAYKAAKRRLFADLLRQDGAAVINADVDAGREMAAVARSRSIRVVTFGRAGDVRLDDAMPTKDGQRLTISVEGKQCQVTLPLVGAFQASNALCAMAMGVATGVESTTALDGLAHLQPAPGRLQRATVSQAGAQIIVDYAHTPDALETALRALRPSCDGNLVVVFGCGGNRDAGKRPQMGSIAAKLADRVIVTDDNPRSEDAAEIRRQILAGCPQAKEIGDRAEAIVVAISGLAEDDLLLIAGKGHEQGQIVGNRVLPFDDVAVARDIVGRSGAE